MPFSWHPLWLRLNLVGQLLEQKEEIYAHVKKLFLPFTVIDVGYWYQLSFPRLPSGRVDYAIVTPGTCIHGDGNAPNLLTDLRDIGRFVARIIADERTLNKYVYTWGDILSENQIFGMMEGLSNEKVERQYVSHYSCNARRLCFKISEWFAKERVKMSASEVEAQVSNFKLACEKSPGDQMKRLMLYRAQYDYSKYIRQDNKPSYARYLGYLDARELYPDFKPIPFHDFLVEVLDGKAVRPYQNLEFGS